MSAFLSVYNLPTYLLAYIYLPLYLTSQQITILMTECFLLAWLPYATVVHDLKLPVCLHASLSAYLLTYICLPSCLIFQQITILRWRVSCWPGCPAPVYMNMISAFLSVYIPICLFSS